MWDLPAKGIKIGTVRSFPVLHWLVLLTARGGREISLEKTFVPKYLAWDQRRKMIDAVN